MCLGNILYSFLVCERSECAQETEKSSKTCSQHVFDVLSRLHRRHLPGDAEDDAHLKELDQQRGSPVAEEGEGDTGGRDQPRHHRHVQKGLQPDLGDDTHHQEGPEPVPCVDGDPVAPEDQQREEN